MADPSMTYDFTGDTASESAGLPEGFFEGNDVYAANSELEYIFGYMAATLLKASEDDSFYMNDSSLASMVEGLGLIDDPGGTISSDWAGTSTSTQAAFYDTWNSITSDQRVSLMMKWFFSKEGSGFLLDQHPVYYPPEVSNNSTKSYGFLDPYESWIMGTRMHAYLAYPNGPWHIEDTGDEGMRGPGSSPLPSTGVSYTTKDLGEGWTWTEISDFKDDNYEYSQSSFDGVAHSSMQVGNSLSCTFKYEAVIVNWFDTVGLYDLDASYLATDYDTGEEYTTYGSSDLSSDAGDRYSTHALEMDHYLHLHPEGTSGEFEGDSTGWYIYQKLAENISFNSESTWATSLGLTTAASALWPWQPGNEMITEGEMATLEITETADSEISDFTTSYPVEHSPTWTMGSKSGTDWTNLLTNEMCTRWRVLHPRETDFGPVYAESDYYEFRISHAINDLGPTLTYPDLPMKFLTKAQVYDGIPLEVLSGIGSSATTSDTPGPYSSATTSGTPGSY